MISGTYVLTDTIQSAFDTIFTESYRGTDAVVTARTAFEASAENEQTHVATVGSAVDDSSESKAEVKAKLSGDVRVNFKSDYLPLEKMATPEMMRPP